MSTPTTAKSLIHETPRNTQGRTPPGHHRQALDLQGRHQ